MNKKNCLTREKRASLFVQSEKLSTQGKNPAFGIFPKATIYARRSLHLRIGLLDNFAVF
jgi:hypothetical protein